MTNNQLKDLAARMGVSIYHAAATCCKTKLQLTNLWNTLSPTVKNIEANSFKAINDQLVK